MMDNDEVLVIRLPKEFAGPGTRPTTDHVLWYAVARRWDVMKKESGVPVIMHVQGLGRTCIVYDRELLAVTQMEFARGAKIGVGNKDLVAVALATRPALRNGRWELSRGALSAPMGVEDRLRELWRRKFGKEAPGRTIKVVLVGQEYRVWCGKTRLSGKRPALNRALAREGLKTITDTEHERYAQEQEREVESYVQSLPRKPHRAVPVVETRPLAKALPEEPWWMAGEEPTPPPVKEPPRRSLPRKKRTLFGKMYDILVYLDL